MFYSPSQNRHKRWYHFLSIGQKKVWALAVFCGFVFAVCLTALLVYSARAASYDMRQVGQSLPGSLLYDEDNHVLAALTEHDTLPVRWDELPPHLVQAFLAREDDHFFRHGGVDYVALLRSTVRNILSLSYKQGASTITMQLTRHVFDLQGKTLDRKMLEIVLAQRVENNYDKHTILCQYLSRIYFGQNCYGLREAAMYYFGKDICRLNLEESALLAGIVRAPSLYNPQRSRKLALKARSETLRRMLELDFISQQELARADSSPIPDVFPVRRPSAADPMPGQLATWANAELDLLPAAVQSERGRGLAAVSYLQLPIQQYVQQAIDRALTAIETPGGPYPVAWESLPCADASAQKLISSAKRPTSLARPGKPIKPGQAKPECCVLVVDSRLNHRGNILALATGRDQQDPRNRWLDNVLPGRTIAPLVFCCACLPGGSAHHIVAHSARITASRLGFDIVHHFFSGLKLETELPDKQHEFDLYDGLFPMRKLDLARLLFDLQNMGMGYRPHLISDVWSLSRRPLYADAQAERPQEYIRRESAIAVSHLPPFRYHEGQPTVLHEELPGENGQWTMVFNDRGVAVFVWMGLEGSAGEGVAVSPELRRMLSHASLALATELHQTARKLLRSSPAKK